MTDIYCKANNPFRLNHPKENDYRVLYDAFFDMQDRLVAAERSLEEARGGYNEHIKKLHDRSAEVGNRLGEATELVTEAHDLFEDIYTGKYLVDSFTCQPYKDFLLKKI